MQYPKTLITLSFLVISSLIWEMALAADPIRQKDAGEADRIEVFAQHAIDYVPSISNSFNHAASLRWPGEDSLNIQVFNTASPIWREILRATSGRSNDTQSHDFVLLQYYPRASLNGRTSPLCFIGFNGDKVAELKAYDAQFPSGYADLYIFLHEIGHCFHAEMHRRANKTWSPAPSYAETVADAFSLAYLLQAGLDSTVADLMAFQKGLPANDPHKDVETREKFIARWKSKFAKQPAPDNALDLFQSAEMTLDEINPT